MRTNFDQHGLARAQDAFAKRLALGGCTPSPETLALCTTAVRQVTDKPSVLRIADEVVSLLGATASKDLVLEASAAYWGCNNWTTLAAELPKDTPKSGPVGQGTPTTLNKLLGKIQAITIEDPAEFLDAVTFALIGFGLPGQKAYFLDPWRGRGSGVLLRPDGIPNHAAPDSTVVDLSRKTGLDSMVGMYKHPTRWDYERAKANGQPEPRVWLAESYIMGSPADVLDLIEPVPGMLRLSTMHRTWRFPWWNEGEFAGTNDMAPARPEREARWSSASSTNYVTPEPWRQTGPQPFTIIKTPSSMGLSCILLHGQDAQSHRFVFEDGRPDIVGIPAYETALSNVWDQLNELSQKRRG